MLGFIWAPLSLPTAYLAYAILHYDLTVVSFFASLPNAQVMISNFPAWVAGGIYAVYGIVLWKFYRAPDAYADSRVATAPT